MLYKQAQFTICFLPLQTVQTFIVRIVINMNQRAVCGWKNGVENVKSITVIAKILAIFLKALEKYHKRKMRKLLMSASCNQRICNQILGLIQFNVLQVYVFQLHIKNGGF